MGYFKPYFSNAFLTFFGIFFVIKLGCVHADHYKILVLFVELVQPAEMRPSVYAIDASKGPKIQKNDLSFEGTHRERFRIDPAANVLEFWSELCSVGFDPIQKSHSLFRADVA